MNRQTEGEILFEKYLIDHGHTPRYEPDLLGKRRRVDFAIDHPQAGTIFLEVKDIKVEFPASGGPAAYDPHAPLRSHIEDGREKFQEYAEYLCVLVLYSGQGSFVDLTSPEIVLGSMYGNLGFSLPFNPQLGHFDSSQMQRKFVVGEGKMVRPSRNQNTRISAILSLHDYDVQFMRTLRHGNTPQGYSELMHGTTKFREEHITGVTVWENATSSRRLPRDLFRGEMDRWWSIEGGEQSLTFVGGKLEELQA